MLQYPVSCIVSCILYHVQTFKEKVTKFKERWAEEAPSSRNLLLWMVRLIHADPMLMLNVSDLLWMVRLIHAGPMLMLNTSDQHFLVIHSFCALPLLKKCIIRNPMLYLPFATRVDLQLTELPILCTNGGNDLCLCKAL